MPAPTVHVQEPLQDRSRRTLEKIGQATEELLATRSFDDIGVNDIVRRARCSVGSFYARFKSKDDLLPYLYERYDADLKPRMQRRIAAVPWRDLALLETVTLVVGHTVDMFAERRHLLRAVALLARANPKAITADVRRARCAITDMPAQIIARCASEIRHADAMEASRIGFFMIAAVAREKILFGEAPHASDTTLSNEELKRQLTHMLYAYLTTPSPTP